jgi:cytochrome c oxidase subunit 2
MKMDAVPGIPTTMWFTPKYTTDEMKVRTGNANFAYEISCDQMCGKGHYSMRGVIVVLTKEEYNKWLAQQEPEYWTYNKDSKPKADTAAVMPAANSGTVAQPATMSNSTTITTVKTSEPTAMLDIDKK